MNAARRAYAGPSQHRDGLGSAITLISTCIRQDQPAQELDGLITWAAGTDTRGLQVVAVWESKSHADRYAAEQLFPAFQESGLAPDEMQMTDYDADEFYLRS